MKDFLKRHGLWVLFAAAVIAVGLAVLSFFSTTSSPLSNFTGMITAPFREGFTAVATWFNDKQAYYADYTALEEENAALKRRIAEMEDAVRKADAYQEENVRLRELSHLQQQREDFDFESATIVERSSSNWTSSLTLNRGTDQDVALRDCVITETGALVGVVSAVGKNWCTVLTLIDTDMELGALVFRSDEIGVAQGDFSLMAEGRLRLSYLPADSQLLGGDLIVTSGLGGYYPSGLLIGQVEEVKIDDSGSTSFAVLRPTAELDSLTQVFIIRAFDIVE